MGNCYGAKVEKLLQSAVPVLLQEHTFRRRSSPSVVSALVRQEIALHGVLYKLDDSGVGSQSL